MFRSFVAMPGGGGFWSCDAKERISEQLTDREIRSRRTGGATPAVLPAPGRPRPPDGTTPSRAPRRPGLLAKAPRLGGAPALRSSAHRLAPVGRLVE